MRTPPRPGPEPDDLDLLGLEDPARALPSAAPAGPGGPPAPPPRSPARAAAPERSGVTASHLIAAGAVASGVGSLVLCLFAILLFLEISLIRRDVESTRAALDANTALIREQNALLASMAASDIYKLDAVMMRGSTTWTLPVSAIDWSGR